MFLNCSIIGNINIIIGKSWYSKKLKGGKKAVVKQALNKFYYYIIIFIN